MNIIEVNRNTLAALYEKNSSSFDGITLDGNMLKYGNEEVDISKYNINDLLTDNENFAASLGSLSPEDVFKIIRLHATLLGTSKGITRGPAKSEDDSQQKIEEIKLENPLLKSISIAYKDDEGIKREYINIVGSDGKDHLFPNDRNVNVFMIYDFLKLQKGGTDVTPDELIDAVYRKLYESHLSTAEELRDKDSTSVDFKNKIERINEPYKDSKTVSVVGNEEHDIAIISDMTDPTNHRVVTFNKNEFGDLVVNQHGNDASEDEYKMKQVDEVYDKEQDEEEVVALLINTQEFYDLINSPKLLTEEERNSVNLYYGYLGDLMMYEDYLVPELRKMLQDFKDFVYELQYGDVHIPLNDKQRESIDKLTDMETAVKEADESKLQHSMDTEKVKRLERIGPADNYGVPIDEDNAGMVSTIQVLAFIIGIAIILTAITLYLIS